jgi:hypothetical protein
MNAPKTMQLSVAASAFDPTPLKHETTAPPNHKRTPKVSVAVFAFDCLYLNGASLLHAPLTERRAALARALVPVEGEVGFATAKTSQDVEELAVRGGEGLLGLFWGGEGLFWNGVGARPEAGAVEGGAALCRGAAPPCAPETLKARAGRGHRSSPPSKHHNPLSPHPDPP